MGKALRLPRDLNLLLPCFGLLALHLHIYCMKLMTQPAGLAFINCGTGTVLCSRGQLGSI